MLMEPWRYNKTYYTSMMEQSLAAMIIVGVCTQIKAGKICFAYDTVYMIIQQGIFSHQICNLSTIYT